MRPPSAVMVTTHVFPHSHSRVSVSGSGYSAPFVSITCHAVRPHRGHDELPIIEHPEVALSQVVYIVLVIVAHAELFGEIDPAVEVVDVALELRL